MSFCFFSVAPVIIQQPRIVKVQKTKVVIIETTVNCQNPPDVQWFKEQTVIKQDNRRTVNIQQVQKVRHPSRK